MTKAEAIFVLEHIEAHNGLAQEAKLMAIDALKQPEIVRCKDCKFAEPHRSVNGDVYFRCNVIGMATLTNHYCSFGERKENK